LFVKACLGEPVERTPVWLMRQAGRYMAEYRLLRQQHDFWTLCRTPELATQVTMQPIDRLGVDAAILFSDILVGLPAMGCDVEFAPGPTLADPVRTKDDIAALKVPDPEADLGFVLEAIRMIRRELDGRVPLIGFGGAPLTLAAYLVEGGGSKSFAFLRSLLYNDPRSFRRLLDHLVECQARFLDAQIEAGAEAVQLFDTWGGTVSRAVYEELIVPPLRRLVERLRRPGVPVIYFIKDGAHVLDLVGRLGADVISVDEKLPLSRVAQLLGPGPALQGNMDPIALLTSPQLIREQVAAVLDDRPKDRGHVFNLGHGILPQTPVEHVEAFVEAVEQLSQERGSSG
jgi:uroporphyrinogen decarboxylase